MIKEGLRLAFGISGRLYRVSPDKAQILKDGSKDWVIPAGVCLPLISPCPKFSNVHQTPIAMSIPLICLNPSIFPSPEKFDPLRWLDNPQLDGYVVSFSKGPRGCVGLNLAWAELYLTIGAMFSRYGGEGKRGMKLWKTTVEDVTTFHDFFVPSPKFSSQGVRVVLSK